MQRFITNLTNISGKKFYRKSLLVVANWFKENLSYSHITKIMVTLFEIQEIIYLSDCDRTTLTVLRLYLNGFFYMQYILKSPFDLILKTLAQENYLVVTTTQL